MNLWLCKLIKCAVGEKGRLALKPWLALSCGVGTKIRTSALVSYLPNGGFNHRQFQVGHTKLSTGTSTSCTHLRDYTQLGDNSQSENLAEGRCPTGLAGGGGSAGFLTSPKPLQLGGDGKAADTPLVARTEGTHRDRGHENICALQDWNQNVFTENMKKSLWLFLQLSQFLLHLTLTSQNFFFFFFLILEKSTSWGLGARKARLRPRNVYV